MPVRPSESIPVINIEPLLRETEDLADTAAQLRTACREFGFFYIVGHGVSETLQQRLAAQSQTFFDLPLSKKMEIRMARGGRAWRGYFPVGEELTSGQPDRKEGLYFGTELPEEDPRVRAGLPLHGRNLFPAAVPTLRETVLSYTEALTAVGHALMRGIGLSLGLPADYFAQRYTTDPLTLFRIFHYPPTPVREDRPQWGVGEHTDYGVLTILKQDDTGGLQIKTKSQWIDAPCIPNAFVCNIGDMLDRMTGSYYRSTPHRVLNLSGRSRYSYPFFFDPNFDARVQPIDSERIPATDDAGEQRWDGADLSAFEGTYGDYILGKVAKVFPQLRRDAL